MPGTSLIVRYAQSISSMLQFFFTACRKCARSLVKPKAVHCENFGSDGKRKRTGCDSKWYYSLVQNSSQKEEGREKEIERGEMNGPR